MDLTVKVQAKTYLWYKVLINVMYLLVCAGILDADTAMKPIRKLSGKGLAYKIGNGHWKRLNRNAECEVMSK